VQAYINTNWKQQQQQQTPKKGSMWSVQWTGETPVRVSHKLLQFFAAVIYNRTGFHFHINSLPLVFKVRWDFFSRGKRWWRSHAVTAAWTLPQVWAGVKAALAKSE
jgi:hypothetical protein